mgnify:CR=1 FL=1
MVEIPTALFDSPVHVQEDAYRNLASLRRSRNLFARLADDDADAVAAINAEMRTRRRKTEPLINRPFERGYGVVGFPFDHRNWAQSRYTNGTFGIWYGSQSVETTVAETTAHFARELADREQLRHYRPITRERRVMTAYVDAVLFDLCGKQADFPGLVSTESYDFTQRVGRMVHEGHHPGLLAPSARRADCVNVDVFSPYYLSNPKDCCYLTYRFYPNDSRIEVEREQGTVWLTVWPLA